MHSNQFFSLSLISRKARKIIVPATVSVVLGITLAGCKSSEEKAEDYYQSGLELLAQGDTDRAIVQFRNVFEIAGNHYAARKSLAEALVSQDKAPQAYRQYLRLAEQYPDDVPTRITLARMAFNALQIDEFERHAARTVELAPDNPDAQVFDLGIRYRQAATSNDAATREDLAAKADALLQSRPDDVILLGIVLDKMANDKNLDRADQLTTKLLALQPDNPMRYQQRLTVLVERGDLEAVEEHLRATLAKFPDEDRVKGDLFRLYMSQQQVDKAEAFMRELADAAPEGETAPLVDLIRFLETEKGREASRAELEKIIAAGKDPLTFKALRAGFDFEEGKRDEAIAELRGLVEGAEPSDQLSRIRVRLAQMLMQTGDEAGSRQEVETVLTANPSQPDALKLKAGWDIRDDKTDAAILDLRTVLDQRPEDTGAMRQMSQAYDRAGEADLARDYLSQAAKASNNAPAETLRFASRLVQEGRYRPAEDAILPALRRAPDNLELLGLLGQVYLNMPDLPRAQGVVGRLRDLEGDQAKAIADQLDLALLAAQEGQQAAMNYLQGLADDEDAGIGPQLTLLRAHLATGDVAEAQEIAEKLVADYPDNPTLEMTLALTRIAGGDLEAGQAEIERLRDANPKQLAPHLTLIRLAMQQGNPDQAEQLLDKALTELPNAPDLLWLQAGLLERGGDIEGAIGIYEKLYERDSGSMVTANNLASLLSTWHAEDPEKVARASAVARRLKDTNVPAFMDTYGWIQHLNGDNETALPYLEGAAAALPNDPMVQLHLGLVQDALGQVDAAKEQLKKGLDILPADRQAQTITQARDVLAKLENPAPEAPAAN